MFMDNQQMAESEIAEMQIKTNAVAGLSAINVAAIDQDGSPLASTTYQYTIVSGGWDVALWDSAIWDSVTSQALAARRISFNAPVVYNRLAIKASGNSVLGFEIGDIYIRARVLGYMQAMP